MALAQDCSNSSALAMELLQSCAKLSKYLSAIKLTLRLKWFQLLEIVRAHNSITSTSLLRNKNV